MNIKIQYTTQEERSQIIDDKKNLTLIEEQNLNDGNFLIFTDEPIEPAIVYTQVNAIEFEGLKSDNEMLKLMVADLGLMVGGGL